jgi:hypothetical protein
MKLQAARIKASDFPPKERAVAELIGGVLNPFIEKVVIGFNKNLTVEDNLPFEFKSIDVRVNASGDPINAALAPQVLTIPTALKSLKGFICINVTDLSGTNAFPTHTPFVVFEAQGAKVTIKKITGLTASKLYRIVLLAIS